MTNSDFFWLVGLLEGEGSFFVRQAPKSAPARKRMIVLALSMTDVDVMHRAAELLNTEVNGPYDRLKDHFKRIYCLELRNHAAIKIMEMVYPHMGARRRAQISNALEYRFEIAQSVPQRRNKRGRFNG